MKEKWIRFMQGRYGIDQFSKFLLITGLVIIFGAAVIGDNPVGIIAYILGWVIIIYSYTRVFSRKILARRKENRAYLAKTEKVRGYFLRQKNIWRQRKDYHIYTCPSCRQKIRIPKGKGKVEIRCPKCGEKFIRRS